jgi:hypothetical protein
VAKLNNSYNGIKSKFSNFEFPFSGCPGAFCYSFQVLLGIMGLNFYLVIRFKILIYEKSFIFNQDRWCMGQIHRSLEKELYQHGIYANLLNWRNETKPVEWQMLNDTYDLFLTNPDAVLPLANCGIPLGR